MKSDYLIKIKKLNFSSALEMKKSQKIHSKAYTAKEINFKMQNWKILKKREFIDMI